MQDQLERRGSKVNEVKVAFLVRPAKLGRLDHLDNVVNEVKVAHKGLVESKAPREEPVPQVPKVHKVNEASQESTEVLEQLERKVNVASRVHVAKLVNAAS